MGKLSLEDLKKLRESKKKDMNSRDTDKDIQIIIGMGTCGIAAGAKETFDSFVKELETQNVSTATIKQTGCMGLCHSEPTVEVKVPEMPTVIYGNVDAAVAKSIVNEHIIKKSLLNDHIVDRPSTDIIK